MGGESAILVGIDVIWREAMLFAAVGFLLGGIDDLLVDLLYVVRWLSLRIASQQSGQPMPDATSPMRFAVFVPAWEESAVIAAMLGSALVRWRDDDVRLYVGAYPNDQATIDAVARVAASDDRVRLVIGPRPGPTTKADNLNVMWRALIADEANGATVDAVILHDAEDVVHADEPRVFARWLATHDVVQLPVLPLLDRGSRWISGHYADEFAEAHSKSLVVRQWLGAGMPLAGTGCAISRAMLAHVADARGGSPFDAASLTEDYELGLALATMRARAVLVRERAADGTPVAVRAFFPATIDAAVRQKARWMIGIALAGWDRIGWRLTANPGEHWMRMRDRRAPLAVLVLAAAYLALLLWGGSLLGHALTDTIPPPLSATVRAVLLANGALLGWRVVMRALFTGRAYGWREAARSLPRMIVGNYVALLAARRAITRYVRTLAGRPLTWDKTVHRFPELDSAGAPR